jgi:cell division protease FtsH
MPPKNNKDPGSPFGDQLHHLPWLILVGVIMMFWILATYPGTGVRATQIPYSEFKTMIRQEAFEEVILGPTAVRGTARAGTGEPPKTYGAVRPEDPDLLREMEARNVRYRVEAQNPWIFYLLSWVVPIVLLFSLWRFFIGRVVGVDRNLMAIERSKAKV